MLQFLHSVCFFWNKNAFETVQNRLSSFKTFSYCTQNFFVSFLVSQFFGLFILRKFCYLFNKFTLKNVCIIQTNCTFIHIFHKTNTRFNSFIFCCRNFHLFKVFTCFSLVFFAQCYTQQRPIYLFIYFLVSLEYINLVRQYIDQ